MQHRRREKRCTKPCALVSCYFTSMILYFWSIVTSLMRNSAIPNQMCECHRRVATVTMSHVAILLFIFNEAKKPENRQYNRKIKYDKKRKFFLDQRMFETCPKTGSSPAIPRHLECLPPYQDTWNVPRHTRTLGMSAINS